MFNDPISDMLTRMRNALLVRKTEVLVPFSKVKWGLAKVIQENGYIEAFEKVKFAKTKKGDTGSFDQILVKLKYEAEAPKEPAIRLLKRVSKPGKRVYVKKEHLPTVLNNFGIAIISTPQGLMTNREARKRGLGGEIICEIY